MVMTFSVEHRQRKKKKQQTSKNPENGEYSSFQFILKAKPPDSSSGLSVFIVQKPFSLLRPLMFFLLKKGRYKARDSNIGLMYKNHNVYF